MQQDIVQQGVDLMVFGMGTVIVFLSTLVCVTVVMSRFMTRYFPEQEKVMPPPAAAPAAVDARTLAVIEAAIAQHRKR